MTSDNPSIKDFAAKVETFQEGLENAWDEIENLRGELQKGREERCRLEEDNDNLRDQVEELQARTDLLRLVQNSDDLNGKGRSVALIQHLRRAATSQRERGRNPKASVNREEAESALHHPDVDRTTIYDDMRRAVRLVDDEDVLRYNSSSGGGSQLELNLEAGDLPREVAGQQTSHGGR